MVSKLKNGLSKAKPSKDQRMQKEDGTLATTPEENAEVFVKHFDKLYNRQPEFDESVLDLLDQHPIAADCDHPPTDEEIQKAISALKNAPGDSGICPPIWKALAGSEETFNLLRPIILHFWETEVTPEEWEIGLLKILPKKGDLSLPGNYRGIMLLETA